MFVSIIIPAFNAEATLGECLHACLAQTYPYLETIVVDDGSTDGTPRIGQNFPVHYVRQQNRGPAAARNRGAAEATGAVLAYTDADCIPAPDWIERLTAGFDEGVGAVGGTYTIANPDSALAAMIHEEIAARHARLSDKVDFLGSFNVAYRREVFNAVGGFDETFAMASAEDNDLAYRILDKGYELRFVPEARVAHVHSTRLGPYLRTQMWHGFWRVKLYLKHRGRARTGDRYAGILDLAGPPLALVFGIAFLLALLLRSVPFLARPAPVVCLVCGCCYVVLHLPMPLKMARRTKSPIMLLFLGVMLARSAARALGMLGGVVRFVLGARKGAV